MWDSSVPGKQCSPVLATPMTWNDMDYIDFRFMAYFKPPIYA